MKELVIYIVFSMSSIVGFSQLQTGDSLHKSLRVANDTSRIDVMINLSEHHLGSNPDSAIYWSSEAAEVSKQIFSGLHQARSLNQLGRSYSEKVDHHSALLAHNNALEIYRSLDNFKGIFNSLVYIGNVYRDKSQLENAANYYTYALEYAMQQNDMQYIADGYNALGELAYYKGDHAEALKNYINAAQHYEQAGNKIQSALVDNNIGIIYKGQGDLENALAYFQKSISQLTELGEEFLLIEKLYDLSSVYLSMGKESETTEPLFKALVISQKIKDKGKVLRTLLRINDAYIKLKNYESGLYYAQESLNLAKEFNNPSKLAEVYMQLAATYKGGGKYRLSIQYFKEAEKIISDLDNYEVKFGLYRDMALTYKMTKNYKRALNYAERSLEVAKKIDVRERIYEATEALYKIFREQNNHHKALSYLEMLMAYRDSIHAENKALEIGKLQAQYEAEKEKQQLALVQKEKDYKARATLSRQKVIRNAFIVGFLFALTMSVFIYGNYKRKSKANLLLRKKNYEIIIQKKELLSQKDRLSILNNEIAHQKERISVQNEILFNKNRELENLNREKDSLLSIVAHDLRAPLNRSKGLAELMKMDGELNSSQRKYLKMMVSVCDEGISLTEDLLCLHSIVQSETEPDNDEINVNAFFDQFLQGYHDRLKKKDLKLHYQPLKRNISIVTDPKYLTRIVDNLFSNAIKFTYPGKNIYLTVEESSRSFQVSIRDEGQGIGEDEQKLMFKKFQKLSALPTGGEHSTGLGLSIVDSLVQKLNGKIKVKSQVGVGTEIILEFYKLKRQISSTDSDNHAKAMIDHKKTTTNP
ncbi:MAG: tetratricopeptide repeat protein [Cytophagales bacterium]|nr:tetratricopeptide repeat protein [Cytophagales bacterium]